VVDFSANTEVRAPADVVIRSENVREVPRSMQPVEKSKAAPEKAVTEVVQPRTTTKKKKESAAPVKRAHKPVIVIDPGHGGVDPGAIGRGKAREKVITFTYAVALKNELEKTGRYKVVLTRRGDYYVNLRKRVAVAQEAQGDIFLSLHADSHPNPTTRGLSIYTLSENASDKEAESLARRANREDVIEGVDLKGEPEDVKSVLIEMTQRDTKNLSARFAEILVKKVGKEARLLKNTHRFAGFVVLKGVDIPSVLVELGYLSNRHEERLLQTEAYKVKLVRAMAEALDVYFDTIPKE
jgi:N-acetylmuramoyl-L-alanine amidase